MTVPPFLVEPAVHDDVEALASVERRCYTHPWSVRGFRDALRRGDRGLILVARASLPADAERGILGYCVIETAADELHVHNLAVRPELQGAGIGRRLLNLALGIGERRGAEVALLEVRASNQAAIELYRSVGFSSVAVRRAYYSQPTEDALVFRKDGLAAAGMILKS